MQCCGVACVGLVVSCGDSAEFLDFLEEVLDQVSPLVHFGVVGKGGLSVRLGGDHGQGTALVQNGPQSVVVEGLVSDQGVEVETGD